MTKIKLCGLMQPEDIAVVNEIRPDFAGFILSARFRRFVPPERMLLMRRLLHPSIPTVGVFVDEPIPYILGAARDYGLTHLQLHGHETEEDIRRLQEESGLPVIKAFQVASPEDVTRAQASPASLVLLDSGTGTGQTFRWELIRGISRPFLLAGGLTPGTVQAAINAVHPYGVDVSSGTETDGQKDPAKLRAFADAVRSLDAL